MTRSSFAGKLGLLLLVPMGLTFYAWKIASENVAGHSRAAFATLAMENEKALLSRVESYNYALLGGVGFFMGSDFVSREEWSRYVAALDVRHNFPGVSGIGWTAPVAAGDLPRFLADMRKEAPGFSVHPDLPDGPYYIVAYLEPRESNAKALGLNITFERNRKEAAELARDSGATVITRRISLVDEEQSSGFLLMHPMYERGKSVATQEERRAAFRGWIYSPIVASHFFGGLTQSQGDTLDVAIYDQGSEAPGQLMYSSGKRGDGAPPVFQVRKTITVMQQKWLVVWSSTAVFERLEHKETPLLILAGGTLLTGLLAVLLLVVAVRNEETIRSLAGERKFALPLTIFIVTAAGALYLYHVLQRQEHAVVRAAVEEEAKKIGQLVSFRASDRLLALKRMAQRWEAAGGSDEKLWRADAANYVDQLTGLRTLEWVDANYRVRWAEPVKGNEKVIGLDVLFDEQRARALKGAEQRGGITLTPPLDLVQGYKAFIAYAPIHVGDRFDGFMAGVFSIEDFLGSLLNREVSGNYSVSLDFAGHTFYRNRTDGIGGGNWTNERSLQVYDKTWTLRVTPARRFVEGQTTALPVIVLAGGLLIALLLALTVRYILISRLKSGYLETSERTFRDAMEHAPIGMALIDLRGRLMKSNPALCELLGYGREELNGADFRELAHPEDAGSDPGFLSNLLSSEGGTLEAERRYRHKDGRMIWTLLSVSLVRGAQGKPEYFIAQLKDVTEQREMERIKREFIAVVSHELRTPVTAIRGSLGLILGAMPEGVPQKAAHLIAMAHKNSERLGLLINDILDIEKLQSGNMQIAIGRVPVAEFLRQVVDVNQSYAEKFQVRIDLEEVPAGAAVKADPDRLAQVMANLLSNASKFSPRGGRVQVRAAQAREVVRFEVQDHGTGIPEQFRDSIFQKFAQADTSASRKAEGTGLGLAITRQLVEAMGGTISFTTQTGAGTTFRFELPGA